MIGRHRGGRAAGRSPGDSFQIPGIARYGEGGVLGRRAHGKFVHVSLARGDSSRLFEPFDGRALVGWGEIAQDFRCTGRQDPLGKKNILEREWNALQGIGICFRFETLVGLLSLLEGFLTTEGEVGAHSLVGGGDSLKHRLCELSRRYLASAEFFMKLVKS